MKLNFSFRYALLSASIFIAIKLATFFSHTQFSGIGIYSGLISLGLTAIPLYLGIKHKRDKNLEGSISLRQAFVTGVTISILAAVIASAYTYFHYLFIDTEVIAHWTEEARRLGEREHKSDTEIQNAIVMLKEFYSPFKQATGTLLGFLGTGAVFSFIISTFLIRKQGELDN